MYTQTYIPVNQMERNFVFRTI